MSYKRIHTYPTCADITPVPGVSECLSIRVVPALYCTGGGTDSTTVPRRLHWIQAVGAGARGLVTCDVTILMDRKNIIDILDTLGASLDSGS